MTTTFKNQITVVCTRCRAGFDAEPNTAAATAPVGSIAISLKPCPRCGCTTREIVQCDHAAETTEEIA